MIQNEDLILLRAWNETKQCWWVTPFSFRIMCQRLAFISDDKDTWILERDTGLKDSNGRKIFEGDIIEYTSCEVQCKGWIVWNKHIGAWQYQYHGAIGGTPTDSLWNLISNTRFPANPVIIGNIHDNPELIK